MNASDRIAKLAETKDKFFRQRESARAILLQLVEFANATDPQDPRLNAIIAAARAEIAPPPPMPTDEQILAAMGPCGK